MAKAPSVAWQTSPETQESAKRIWSRGKPVSFTTMPINQLEHFSLRGRHAVCGKHPNGCAAHVESLAQSIAAGGGPQEPIVVFRDRFSGRHVVNDGNHRVAAAQKTGHTHVPVMVVHNAGDGSQINLPFTKSEGKTMKVASTAAFNDKGELLFGRRLDNGKWTLPGGGMEGNERPAKAAVRELYEEAGLKPKELEELGSMKLYDGKLEVWAFKALVAGTPTGEHDPDEECEEWKFVDVKDGIPKDILDNLHSPKNVVLKLLGLQDWEEEKPLKKTDDGLIDDEIGRLIRGATSPTEVQLALKMAGAHAGHLSLALEPRPAPPGEEDGLSFINDLLDKRGTHASPNVVRQVLAHPAVNKHHLMQVAGDHHYAEHWAADVAEHPHADGDVIRAMHAAASKIPDEDKALSDANQEVIFSAKKNPHTPADVLHSLLTGPRAVRANAITTARGATRQANPAFEGLVNHPNISTDTLNAINERNAKEYADWAVGGAKNDEAMALIKQPQANDPHAAFRTFDIPAMARQMQDLRHMQLTQEGEHTLAHPKATPEMLEAAWKDPSTPNSMLFKIAAHEKAQPEWFKKMLDRSYNADVVANSIIQNPAASPRILGNLLAAGLRSGMSNDKAQWIVQHPNATPEVRRELLNSIEKHSDEMSPNHLSEAVKVLVDKGEISPKDWEMLSNSHVGRTAAAAYAPKDALHQFIDKMPTPKGEQNYFEDGPNHTSTDTISGQYLKNPNIDASHLAKILEKSPTQAFDIVEHVKADNQFLSHLANNHAMGHVRNAATRALGDPTALDGLADKAIAGDHQNAYRIAENPSTSSATLDKLANHYLASKDIGNDLDAQGVISSLAKHKRVSPAVLHRIFDFQPTHGYVGTLEQAKNDAIANPNADEALLRRAVGEHEARPGWIPAAHYPMEFTKSSGFTPQMARELWKKASPNITHDAAAAALTSNTQPFFRSMAEAKTTPADVLHEMIMDPRLRLAASKYALRNMNVAPETLKAVLANPQMADMHHDAQSRLYRHFPDGAYKESTDVRISPKGGLGKLRKIRDLILERSKSGEVPPKALPPGDWSVGRLPNGNISAAKIQEHIDSIPPARWNVSHTTWNGAQMHTDDPQKVFQLNISNDHIQKMKDAGVLNTFWDMMDTSRKSGHPVTDHTIGWVRHTGSQRGVTRTMEKDPALFLDKVRADHLKFGQRLPELIEKLQMKNATPENSARFGMTVEQMRESIANNMPKLHRDMGHALSMAGHGIGGKQLQQLLESEFPFAQHVREHLDPEAFRYAPIKQTGGIHVDEVQSDFGQSFVKQAANQARQQAESEARAQNMTPEQTQEHITRRGEEAAKKAGVRWPEEHYKKITDILFNGRHPNEVVAEGFVQHLRDKKATNIPIQWHTPESKAPISGLKPNMPVPGHFKVSYDDVPKRLGAEPSTYGSIPTQNSPKHQGKPTWELKVRKYEDDLGDWFKAHGLSKSNLVDEHSEIARHMHGFQPQLESAFEAARFLTGSAAAPLDALRRAFWEADGSAVDAALLAYGLEANDENREALRAVMDLKDLEKGEYDEELLPVGSTVQPANQSGAEFAKDIAHAIKEKQLVSVHLGGKHSKGSLVARADTRHYLLKPGSGPQSPAAGARDSSSSQSQREAAFWHMAEHWGLSDDFAHCELLFINGKQYAVMELIPWSFKPMEKAFEKDPSEPSRDLEHYRQNGRLHRWAVLDFVLGNTDRHAQNLMVSPEGKVKLIDHGSAFAGVDFDPAYDKNSFIPFYLRYIAPPGTGFNALSMKQKLHYMVEAPTTTKASLTHWLDSLHAQNLETLLPMYGIDPAPMVARLQKLKQMVASGMAVDVAINQLWAGT